MRTGCAPRRSRSNAIRSPKGFRSVSRLLALAAKLAGWVRGTTLEVAPPTGDTLGYELLALAVRAEAEGVDPEAALRAAARAYRDAILAAEGVHAPGTVDE